MKNFIKLGTKTYSYLIEAGTSNESSLFICKGANINQEFLKEDIVDLLNDLPNLIQKEEEYKVKQDQIIRFRVSGIDKLKIQQKARESGFSSVSNYIKTKVL